LFIVGAGGLGREVESWFRCAPAGFHDPFHLAGYLDSFVPATDHPPWPSGLSIVGAPETFPFTAGDAVIVAIADVARRAVYAQLAGRVEIISFISHAAVVSPFARIGEGCIICPMCVVSGNVELGRGVIANSGTQIGHDAQIGEFSSLMAHVDIGGGCILGKEVFMGTQSMVVPRKRVADAAQLSAGCVLTRSIKEPGGVYFGNPAVRLR